MQTSTSTPFIFQPGQDREARLGIIRQFFQTTHVMGETNRTQIADKRRISPHTQRGMEQRLNGALPNIGKLLEDLHACGLELTLQLLAPSATDPKIVGQFTLSPQENAEQNKQH